MRCAAERRRSFARGCWQHWSHSASQDLPEVTHAPQTGHAPAGGENALGRRRARPRRLRRPRGNLAAVRLPVGPDLRQQRRVGCADRGQERHLQRGHGRRLAAVLQRLRQPPLRRRRGPPGPPQLPRRGRPLALVPHADQRLPHLPEQVGPGHHPADLQGPGLQRLQSRSSPASTRRATTACSTARPTSTSSRG